MLISELAAATNETPRTLRFYETAGVLPAPPRTHGRYRDYPDTAIGCVKLIRTLQSTGLALDQIATILRILDSTSPPHSTDIALLETTMVRINTQIATLYRMRQELEPLVGQSADRRPHQLPNPTDRSTRRTT